MSKRDTMRQTNKLCREWLFENGYDYVWLKPHMDGRNKKFKELYFTKEGTFFQTDIYNLFDGICFDSSGILTFLQMSTTNWHPEKPYVEFLNDKKGFKILMLRAIKKKNRWQVQTKEISRSKLASSSQCHAPGAVPTITPIG